jgi:hypothetical protein
MPTLGEGRALAIATAFAKEAADELTVILSCASELMEALDDDDPSRPLLLELQNASQRCVAKTGILLRFTSRRGTRPSSARLEALVDGY